MTQQKGFAHAFLIIGLALALAGALGFIFWQNFIYEKPVPNKAVAIESNGGSDNNTQADKPVENTVQKASLTQSALESKLPEGCSLGISDDSRDFDIDKLAPVSDSSPALGPLDYKQYGRVNEDKSWAYVAGGCGSSAGAFVLKDNSGVWELVAYHTGDAWFGCDKVDGKGIPQEVVGLCIDYATNKERAIRL